MSNRKLIAEARAAEKRWHATGDFVGEQPTNMRLLSLCSRLADALEAMELPEGWETVYRRSDVSVFLHPNGSWLLNKGGAVFGDFPTAREAVTALEKSK